MVGGLGLGLKLQGFGFRGRGVGFRVGGGDTLTQAVGDLPRHSPPPASNNSGRSPRNVYIYIYIMYIYIYRYCMLYIDIFGIFFELAPRKSA